MKHEILIDCPNFQKKKQNIYLYMKIKITHLIVVVKRKHYPTRGHLIENILYTSVFQTAIDD